MVKVTALNTESVDACPVRQVLSQVTGKWQILIVLALEERGLRFAALRREIGDITQRVLTENLRKLERDGYLKRDVDPGPPLAVHYSLTPLGAELVLHLKPLVFWAKDSHQKIIESRNAYTAQSK